MHYFVEGFNHEGLSQQELSQKLVVSKSNVVGLIDRLEKAGYVKRESHPNDRRQYVLHLTAKANELIKRVDTVYFKKVQKIMGNFSQSKKQTLINCLETMRDNISQIQTSREDV